MRDRFLRCQMVVFGKFNFPPMPDITVSLMQSFAHLSFMPMVVQQLDPELGMPVQRISLTKENVHIIFGNDRIDFTEMLPAEDNFEDVVDKLVGYLSCLQSRNLEFNRIALIKENIKQDLTADQIEFQRIKYVPNSTESSSEWVSRWVSKESTEKEVLNVCYEIIRLKGMMVNNGRTENIDGLKVMHDISTFPDNFKMRFNSANLMAGFDILKKKIAQQSVKYNID